MVQANTLKKMQRDSFAKGKVDGETEWIKKGIEQGQTDIVIKIARRLLATNMDVKQIIEITNLQEDEIKNLR